jgi:hypothetical protein
MGQKSHTWSPLKNLPECGSWTAAISQAGLEEGGPMIVQLPDAAVAAATAAAVVSRIGLGTEFRSENILRNRLGMISVIPRKKVLIPKHSAFRGRVNSEARNGTERNEIPRKNEILRNKY